MKLIITPIFVFLWKKEKDGGHAEACVNPQGRAKILDVSSFLFYPRLHLYTARFSSVSIIYIYIAPSHTQRRGP